MHRQYLAVAVLSFGMTSFAHAATSNPALQIASAVGHWIAEQGNSALREMREELRRDLERQLKPLVPALAPPAERDAQPDEPAGS